MRITVIGAGSWGTAFSVVLRDRGHEVTLACRDPEHAAAIVESRYNPRYFPHVDLTGIAATAIEEAPIATANLAVVAVPSAAFGATVAALSGTCPILSLAKGLDPATGNRLSTLVTDRPVAVLSGPNIAEEISRGLPGAAVVAGLDHALSIQIQLAITSPTFRVYVNDDVTGVELCAAAKNVIALAAGGADGLGLGDNAKAALVARGLAEMGRFAEASGAKPETFAGLAGMGDLIVTCWSKSGRNRRAGELIAQGSTPDEARAEIGTVVEGLTTAPVLRDLSRRLRIEMPITDGVCAVLDGVPLVELVATLMDRDPTSE
ncbi:MAG: NAD(P)-dependent glycerol-3-phosphate dehydrogenase [Thermoleophilia bacterium]|nr:NAD(P)-dependent glycerol-3-phosphate dehydrogenase [Thermoleophilia bacterium]